MSRPQVARGPGSRPGAPRTFLRENALSLIFGALFVGTLTAQALVGHALFNGELAAAGQAPVSLWRYVSSSEFAVNVMENWQSEFLQFLLFILATVWWVQRGSTESKPADRRGRESDADQFVGRHARTTSPRWARARGWRLRLYSHSLGIVMGTIFALSWLGQSLAGAVAYSREQVREGGQAVTWLEYVTMPDFWDRTLQNWQSEFLAVLAMVIFTIYLRERGSPESKPVGAAHDATGAEG